MEDLISRKAAIDALCDNCDHVEGACPHYPCKQYIAIEDLPSTQPEGKKGFWYTLKKGDKGYSAGDFKCSVCGEPNHTWLPKPKFCPNCGADMSI